MRVLLVEKDPAAAADMEELLGNEATAVDRAVQARHALRLAESGGYDAVLIDGDLPDADGHEILKRLRGAGVRAPVIMLGRRGDVEDKLRAFGNGADDYVASSWPGCERSCAARGGRPATASGAVAWSSTRKPEKPGWTESGSISRAPSTYSSSSSPGAGT